MNNLFKHTSRSYFDVFNPLVQAYPNKPTWLFEEMGGLFDFSSELMNRIASDFLFPKTRESAYGFASRCDYEPTESDGATTTLTITLNSAMAKTLAIGYQVGGISGSTGDMVVYELTAEGNSGATDTITVNAKQKFSYTNINIGTIDNQNSYSDYPITGYAGIIRDSISLVIDSNDWTRVSNFDSSSSTDKHFTLLYQSNGKSRVQFGDNTNGLIPTLSGIIYADFEITKGLLGRMDADEINLNTGGDTDISTVTNDDATSGGNASETVSAIIRNARGNVRLRDAVWSKEDLETAARQSSSTVQKALGIPAIGKATIHIVPSGGGNPSEDLKTTTTSFVKALTQFGTMPISVLNPSYVTVNIAATQTIRSGFVEATVDDLTEFALTLSSSAFDNQIIEHYQDNGIDSTRDVINVIWSWSFASAENEALAFIIDKWVELLGTKDFREFGQDMEVGDFWIMGNSLYDYGVDEFSMTTPTTNTTATSTQIISTGTVAVT